MKYIDINNWARKQHFNFFRAMDNPHFNICANVDITALQEFIRTNKQSFFRTVLYIATRSANQVSQFRQRIRNDQVVEHDSVQARFTVPGNNDVFGFCTTAYSIDFNDFYSRSLIEIEKAAANIEIGDVPGRDDLVYMSCLPWITFTSYSNAMHLSPVDSIPRIVWGKYFSENGRVKMPLSVQAHHALVDGRHIGEYFSFFESLCMNPERLKSEEGEEVKK